MEILGKQEIKKMDILIPFKGSLSSLNEIIKGLEAEPKKIVINNIDIQKGEETEVSGNINLGVYSLTGIVDNKEDEFTIETTNNNTLNPFIPYKGYVKPNKEKPDYLEDVSDEVDNGKVEEKPVEDSIYDTYKAIKGDNISYISMIKYGTEKYVDEILDLNDMGRYSILQIGKQLKLKKR